MFDYVDKIIIAFDKAELKGGGTKLSAAPDDSSRLTKTARSSGLKSCKVSQPGGQDTICRQMSLS